MSMFRRILLAALVATGLIAGTVACKVSADKAKSVVTQAYKAVKSADGMLEKVEVFLTANPDLEVSKKYLSTVKSVRKAMATVGKVLEVVAKLLGADISVASLATTPEELDKLSAELDASVTALAKEVK